MSYKIPQLPLAIDMETKAVLRQLNLANKKLAELKGVAQTILYRFEMNMWRFSKKWDWSWTSAVGQDNVATAWLNAGYSANTVNRAALAYGSPAALSVGEGKFYKIYYKEEN